MAGRACGQPAHALEEQISSLLAVYGILRERARHYLCDACSTEALAKSINFKLLRRVHDVKKSVNIARPHCAECSKLWCNRASACGKLRCDDVLGVAAASVRTGDVMCLE